MTIPQIISESGRPGFSIEVLPPLKGRNISRLYASIDRMREFGPRYVNITTHRSEIVYTSTDDGLYRRESVRSRPGTVAVAAAVQQRYGIPAVPHIICSGYSRKETEYALIDLSFLDITNILLLRGDKAKHESSFNPDPDGHSHALELEAQINDFNAGLFIDGTKMETEGRVPFSFGVAGYPEKHEEAPNVDFDIEMLRRKIEAGADYVVTQMFFDNARYFDFVARCRAAGINVPIIPGIKPITREKQMTLLPKVFHVDLPTELSTAILDCKGDKDAVTAVGVDWCARQVKELYDAGVPSVHFYTVNAVDSVYNVLKRLF